MNYEEKLNLAKEALKSGSYDKETIEYIFSELAESEDERIRKAIIYTLRDYKGFLSMSGISKEEMITWLEKQGEQKPVWKPSDEQMRSLSNAINVLHDLHENTDSGFLVSLYNDLKKLKED